ncbi:M3 family oligoendopeptidase [Cytobacillus sp. IB215316]|uniref:M3 family oligoendopeptidase n=1 Tax=Cytobacillus sp. IB215316 TaxID=3097354 RepID=UPI002A0F701A|nr:M3 family oligoendopeptidase [Cytobacillus sp. IB215316]MDX8359509.1 M3 family oligoendopeptidase [Cytobacillus sp. IB215316]
MNNAYLDTWDLESIFKGGSDSEDLQNYIEQIEMNMKEFQNAVQTFESPSSGNDVEGLHNLIDLFQSVAKKIRQTGAFVSCLQAQDTSDVKANILRGEITQLNAAFATITTHFDEHLVSISDEVWDQLLLDPLLAELSYVLTERRKRASEKLPIEQEELINSLSVDGYHSWGQMYNLAVGKMKIPFEVDGKLQNLSIGQAANQFSSKDKDTRESMFEKWEQAWGEQADFYSEILNHLGGFRLQVYNKRGWDDVLKEPLDINRMSKQTLDTMWSVITDLKQPFVDYLNRKAKLLNVEKLSWSDLDAPVGKTDSTVTYQEGAEFILKQFGLFGEQITDFTQKAFNNRWIEAEDRSGKRPGGFCTSFPDSDESRIFMTFSGTPSNVSTLAHELGHAFHQHAMGDVHPLNQSYAMNVAETASTFAEMIVADAAVQQANSKEEKIALLEDKIQRSVAFYMNIHARFMFETAFYEERKKGMVSTKRLNELMLQAQKEAYCDSLEQYHPHFWASKLHFYITGVPFYNFPYTFGYLFSLGIYKKSQEEGKQFEEKYIALLQDTARMTVEELAHKHLGIDLTQRDFWEQAVKLSIEDVKQFMELTE